jgi:hypothetical protein
VGPRAGLDVVERRQILLLPGLELRSLSRPLHSPYRLSYPGSSVRRGLSPVNVEAQLRRLQSLTLCGAVCTVSFRRVVMKVFACSTHKDAASSSDCTAATDWMIVNSYFSNLLIHRRCQYRNCVFAASMKGILMDVELLMERKLTRETEDPSATLHTTNST